MHALGAPFHGSVVEGLGFKVWGGRVQGSESSV